MRWTPELFLCFRLGISPARPFWANSRMPASPPFEKADRGQLRPEYKKAYQACLKLFWEHVKQKGWDKKFVLYISDEPYYWLPRIIRANEGPLPDDSRGRPAHPHLQQHVEPRARMGRLARYLGHSDITGWCRRKQIAKLRSAGDRVWWTTDGQMCTDTPYCAVERLLPHYCFKYGAEAYEFWGICWTTYDPHRFGWHAFIHQPISPASCFGFAIPTATVS